MLVYHFIVSITRVVDEIDFLPILVLISSQRNIRNVFRDGGEREPEMKPLEISLL